MIKKAGMLAGMFAALTMFSTSAQAEYPEKPIEFIVAFTPGGGTDIAARSIARFMEKHLGNGARIAVINKPGAGGEIGWTTLARAKGDGYTIGMINAPAINALEVEGKAKYKMADYQTIANLVSDPGILIVNKNSPYKTLEELIAAAKAAPGTVVIGVSGAAGSSDHIGILSMNRLTQAEFKPAFFGGTSPVRQAILGGHIPAATLNLSEVLPLVREGELRILGIMSEERSEVLKDAPTFREQGIDLVVTATRGITAPKGVPADIIAKLEKAVEEAMKDPEYLEAAKKAEIPLHYMNASDYRKMLNEMSVTLAETWKVTPWR